MNTKLEAMLAKVAALRTLAARATTQGEAEAAAAQAATICAKYQIDEASIPAADERRDEAIGEESLPQGKRTDLWASALFAGLAKDHGCAGYRANADLIPGSGRHDGKLEFRLVGRPSDIAIVKYLFAWLAVETARLAAREHGRADRNSFKLGCMVGVLAAMRAARKTEVAQTTASAALVLHNREADAWSWLKTSGMKFSGQRRGRAGGDAFERGKAAGGSINTSQRALAGGSLMLKQ